jgi:L-amino acid N-acyltransferase YncA
VLAETPPPTVRAAVAADAPGIAEVYRPYVTGSAVSFEEVPPDAVEVARRMARSPRLPWFVAARGGQVVGWSAAVRHRERAAYRWTAECSVYLVDDERGRGTGRRLYEVLLAELRALGYVTALAVVTLPNDDSEAFHRALGFAPVARLRAVGYKHGAWRDVAWWQRPLREDPPAVPAEPVPWSPPGLA